MRINQIEDNSFRDIPDQIRLWDNQHGIRGSTGPEGSDLINTPNNSAIELIKYLPSKATILEVGSANGRDARFWAGKGHKVYAIDFSTVALHQLQQLAQIQQISDHITTVLWDISCGHLPCENLPGQVSAFYARSALHIGDEQMTILAKEINNLLIPGGIILLEGKAEKDKKIQRSKRLSSSLALDECENGHLRRIWDEKFVVSLCAKMNWSIVDINENQENWQGKQTHFLRFLIRKD